MVLDMPGGLFGDKNPLTDEKGREYTLMRLQEHIRMVSPGWAVIGSATFIAGGAQNYKKVMGFETSVHMLNESGATRNSTIKIENLTLGLTLVNGNVDVADGGFFNTAFSWALEHIRPGDSIKFTIGNEGVGTHTVQGTKYWSLPGIGFKPNLQSLNWDHSELRFNANANLRILAPVELPDGAVVTGVVVFGNDTSIGWRLTRASITNGLSTSDMASANFGTEDTSISNATIDNALYTYGFLSDVLDSADDVDGARISYTETVKGSSTQGYYRFRLSGFFKSVGETSND